MGSDQHFRSADRIGRHAMPFGAEVLAEGGVRFRLWAPAARKVELVVANKSKSLNPLDSGWFELVERDAAAGTLYQYRIDGRQLVPDPASRFQPKDVDGPSEVIDPSRYPWKDAGWRGRPWQEAVINFGNEVVRQYFIHNVLYWLEEYHFDGLRFDAVHAIVDHSPRHILDEIRDSVPARKHLVLENDANQARFVGPGKYNAQWNDDSHHAYHVLATGETDGYYISYADAPARHLARCLAEGFAYQGEVSPFSKEPRGEKSSHLPASCFVDFLQNHDQVGNRALGERLLCLSDERKIKALTAIQLLAPSPPLVFMGDEWGCRQPFLFFFDFDGELGEAVRNGRREEFSRFRSFTGHIPDPLAESTFKASTLDWSKADQVWLAHYKNLLTLRQRHVVPLNCGPGKYGMLGD